MTYRTGHYLPPGGGDSVGAIGLDIVTKIDGSLTGNAYSLFEYIVPPGVGGPPPHTHSREDESFVCMSGKLQCLLGTETYELLPGYFLYLPRNVRHTFSNPYDDEARVTSVVSPAGLEHYYRELSELPPGPRDMDKMTKIMSRYGLELQI